MSRAPAPNASTRHSVLIVVAWGGVVFAGACVGQSGDGGGGTVGSGSGGQAPGATGGATSRGSGGGTGTGNGNGTIGSGGSTSAGGSPAATGGSAAGTGGTAGRPGTGGGAAGRAGTGGTAGRPGTGGVAPGTGGATTGPGGSTVLPTTPPANCGGAPLNETPLGCSFAWGRNNPGGALTSYTYLQFMSFWVGAEVRSDGTYPSCSGCTWLTSQVSKTTNLIPVFYGYLIGYFGHVNGLPDGNVSGPPNLTTGGAALIRNNRAKIVQMHSWYAQQAYAVWKTKPLIWLLDGDYVQYTAASQGSPLTYAELGQLTAEITCAIKAAMPNAVVAINHSAWNANEVTDGFWGGMSAANAYYDLVWTTGMGSANGFFDTSTNAASYNGGTATYAYLHKITGRKIFVDTSFSASAMADSWSTTTAANLNARIADGVIAANITGTVPSNYSTAIAALATAINPVCP